ncbi:hypothetical protein [Amphibacillus cookii]|uniref:hypothetical protein n=1 Tax=Amphibacillus cookii TaxID=767787 RepID=UPI00195681EB|nr:hypothetical protein [Amphibacillus cookii]MBM7541278.1 hypothetical protein [Amphibacillus cookii]
MDNTLVIIALAIVSSSSRGIISVIDRYQIGFKKNSVIDVNLYNNLYTISLVFIISLYFPIGDIFTDYKVYIYSLIVQFVAMGYSYLFKNMTIFESAIAAKTADVFIPIAVFLATGVFEISTYLISILTTLMVYFWLKNSSKDINKYLLGIFVIVPLLVIQSFLSPILVSEYKGDPYLVIGFTIVTLYIRFFISFVLFLFTNKLKKSDISFNLKGASLYIGRGFLTIIAQLTFVIVTASNAASLGWIFLNMTSFYGVIYSSIFLKEKVLKKDFLFICAITAIVVIKELLS